ncbi:MAG TPA: hypothetical protein VJC06_03000 [Candidatus Paceibacterota bacterium]
MLKNKTILMVIVVAILVVTGFIGTRFVFKKFNVPSILPFSTTPQTSPYAGSSKSKEDVASQIRALNKTLNEYNIYNNSANQLNNSNTPL